MISENDSRIYGERPADRLGSLKVDSQVLHYRRERVILTH